MLSQSLLLQAAAPVVQIGLAKYTLWWWPFIFALIKNMFILLDILIFVALVMLIYRFQSFGVRIHEAVDEIIESGKFSKDNTQRKWDAIKSDMGSENMDTKKRAVIAAESILDDVLKTANFPGENLGSRLEKISEGQLNFKDDVEWAFKFEEKIKADESFAPDEEEISRAFYIFERTLRELNVID